MTDLGKVLLGFGLLLVAVGALLLVVGSVFGRGTWLGLARESLRTFRHH